jgi:hypothetical protein
VLVRSGITGGLRRQVEVERDPVTVDATPPAREDTSWEVLAQAGFQLIGQWTSKEDGIALNAQAPAAPGVYAFVVDDIVVYVGLTMSGLHASINIGTATKAKRLAQESKNVSPGRFARVNR